MTRENKTAKYDRIVAQLEELYLKTPDPIARMATASALLKGKFKYFFWVGFYRLVGGELTVGPYQGALACQVLKKHTGVCWAAIDRGETVLVPDVEAFPGHIACDSRSRSEVVVPLRDRDGRIWAVLDVDSDELDSFDADDVAGLKKVAALIDP
ncbi:MAG TPA: GAF domain-containing protein [bacterium]|nr:GAF domain-containing protein [bacterium]